MKYIKNFPNYIVTGLIAGNLIVEVIKPQSTPQDHPNDGVVLHGIAGTFSGSTLGVYASYPYTELKPTTYIDRYGNSVYEVPFVEDDFFN